MTDRLKIGQEVLIHGYVDEIRKDTIIIKNEGGYFGTVECEVTDIEIPNTNEVLDKIRAEIEARECDVVSDYTDGYRTAIQGDLIILDKYRAEREDVTNGTNGK